MVNIRSSSRFGEAVFAACPRLRLISIWGTGTDNVDLAAAARHGITVTNTPGVAAHSVAEHALALDAGGGAQHPADRRRDVRGGEWRARAVTQLRGKTLGVIGLGAIGRAFARLGAGIGMRVIAWTVHPDPAPGFALVSRRRPVAHRGRGHAALAALTPETRGIRRPRASSR